jgi:hypothetical protein
MTTRGSLICLGCGSPRTDDEIEFYDERCESCERIAWQALQRWKAGQPNAALDQRFPNLKPTVH